MSTNSGRKRRASRSPATDAGGNDMPSASSAPPTKKPRSSRTTGKVKGKRKRRANGISKRDTPDGAGPTRDAFTRHIRALAGLLNATSVLNKAETLKCIEFYNQRRNSANDSALGIRQLVDQCRAPNAEAHRRAEQLLDNASTPAAGPIANDIATIPAKHLASSFAAVARTGLKAFLPDVFGPKGSSYNELHRHLAVSTFTAIATWFGFTELTVSLGWAQDVVLLEGIYDNFVYGTLRSSSRLADRKGQKKLVETAELTARRRRRERLCDRRYTQAKLEGWRKPILRMVKNDGLHSDDEPIKAEARKVTDPVQYVYHACEKPYRNAKLTGLFRSLDERIQDKLARTPKPGKLPDPRKVDQLLPPSALSKIHPTVVDNEDKPKKNPMPPIDAFDSMYYNRVMDMEERAFFADGPPAFPPLEYCTGAALVGHWMSMSSNEFMPLFGEETLAEYLCPTPEEMEAERERMEAEDADDEMETDLDDTDREDDNDKEEGEVEAQMQTED
ncbi:hypothetical protein C8F01DRAFT_1158086 [Mycena amicta]|nr:hypothetical protein C8F01DRAFT_1158086 [Mycena amicta]